VTAMNPTFEPTQPQPQRRRGRLQLLLILAVVIAPMLLASAMYRFGFWVPKTRSYDGVLVANGQGRDALGITAPMEAEPRWELLVTAPQGCADACQELVYLARQINIGLAREAGRASHALASGTTLDGAYEQQLQREYPQLQRYSLDAGVYGANADLPAGPQLWIVDPHGNLVLRYDEKTEGKAILDDLKHLLKISQIG
jgi:nitrate reductase NapE component